MQRRFAIVTAIFIVLTVAVAEAQTAPRHHIRGTIQAVDQQSLTISTRDSGTVTVVLKEPLAVTAMKRLDISAIQSGTFIGTAARPGPNEELVAVEVVVFPNALRGVGEGHYGWDLAPDSTMTNATITALVESSVGREIALNYKGGSTKVLVPPDIPIVGPIPADRADLKPGASVFLTPIRAADGTLSTGRVIVGKDGLVPPM